MTQHHVPTWASIFRPHRTTLQESALGEKRAAARIENFTNPGEQCPSAGLCISRHFTSNAFFFIQLNQKTNTSCYPPSPPLSNGHPSHHGDELNHITSLAKPSGMRQQENNKNNNTTTKVLHYPNLHALVAFQILRGGTAFKLGFTDKLVTTCQKTLKNLWLIETFTDRKIQSEMQSHSKQVLNVFKIAGDVLVFTTVTTLCCRCVTIL